MTNPPYLHQGSKASSGEKECLSHYIVRVNDKLMPSRDECLSTYFGYNRFIWPNPGMIDYSPTERAGCSQDALDHNMLPLGDLASGMVQGQARGNARARRRAINLGVGKDADIATMMRRIFRCIGENRAVQKAQVALKRMLYG